MFHFFKKPKREKPPYLERIDELPKLDIVRLRGRMDHTVIPLVEERIKENRRLGSQIDRNVVLDFSKVEHVDSATIAFHIFHLKEYQEKGFKVGFINLTDEMKVLLDIFKENEVFTIFANEDAAVKALNR